MDQSKILPENCSLLLSQDIISKKVKELANELNSEYADKQVVYLTIMNGGMIFASDLSKQLDLDMEMDYVQVSRYGTKTTGGQLIWKHQCETSLKDKHVIITDDLFDQGHTLLAVHLWCQEQGAKSVQSAVLISKIHQRGYADYRPNYFALEVEDLYIFGYGMDYQEKLRHLNNIYYLNI